MYTVPLKKYVHNLSANTCTASVPHYSMNLKSIFTSLVILHCSLLKGSQIFNKQLYCTWPPCRKVNLSHMETTITQNTQYLSYCKYITLKCRLEWPKNMINSNSTIEYYTQAALLNTTLNLQYWAIDAPHATQQSITALEIVHHKQNTYCCMNALLPLH